MGYMTITMPGMSQEEIRVLRATLAYLALQLDCRVTRRPQPGGSIGRMLQEIASGKLVVARPSATRAGTGQQAHSESS